MSQQPATDKAAQRGEELQRISGPALQTNNAQLPVPTKAAPDFDLGNQGVVIRTLDDAWTLSNIVFNSQLAPQSLKSPAQVLIALQMGMEVGLPPMAAIQNVAVINGRPSLWGDIMIALCRASGKFDEEAFEQTWEYGADGLATKAICTVRRLPNGKPIVSEFTWAEAIAAKLDTKDAYKFYRKRMLMNRARAFALRDGFSDVLRGVISAEEAQDLPEKNITASASATRKPSTLEELTEQLSASETSAETAVATETPTPEAESAPTQQEATADPMNAEDPMIALKQQLEECRTVPDVTRVRNSFTGPASKLTDKEKADINAVCESRAQAIRADRKSTGTQASLV